MSMTHNSTADAAFLFWLSVGMARHHAAGLVAQEFAESGYDPKAVGDHHQAFGLFQVHGARAAAIKHGCGIDLTTLPPQAKQLQAAWYELSIGGEKRALKMIKATLTAYNAGHDACRYWERPANKADWAKRGNYAVALLADFNARKIGVMA
jgi:hypothetical protein